MIQNKRLATPTKQTQTNLAILVEEQTESKVCNLFRIMADPTRMKLLRCLKNSKLSVTQISELLGMTQSAISHQLRTLKDANIVVGNKVGREVFYYLHDTHVHNIISQATDHVRGIGHG